MTRKIGRYEILGELATGGMAEILLARLVGPSGFERPVVIKRIRPDLDREVLTSLFLDEARLVAKVRHANVVHVEDLGVDEEGAPYLVMEYLEGESLANLSRRLISRGEVLPHGLAAYVVAEAAAGLHAAHELRDASGKLLNVVHRDVSPQNIFVTYEGVVKMVDFGIAKTVDTAETEAGQVRGKSGYMAPEQFRTEPIDRRTDVFALGIVLWELVTGKRLFARFGRLATVRATLEDPILPPSRVASAVPAAIEAICARSLRRPREERYGTAAEMRRELLAAVRALVPDEPSAEMSALMRACFSDRIEDKTVWLRSVRQGTAIDHVPAGDVDVTVEVPAVIAADLTLRIPVATPGPPPASVPTRTQESTGDVASSVTSDLRAPSRRRPRLIWLAPIVVLSITVAAIGLAGRVRDRHANERATTSDVGPPLSTLAAEIPAPTSGAPATAPPATVSAPPTAIPAIAVPAASAPSRARGGVRRRPPEPHVVPVAPPPTADPPTPSAAPSESARGFHRFQ